MKRHSREKQLLAISMARDAQLRSIIASQTDIPESTLNAFFSYLIRSWQAQAAISQVHKQGESA
jgi:hypothetical protein